MKQRPWWEDADDAERLVIADGLTVQGDPRGEFIVLQCTEPTSPRAAELWKAHHLEWLTALGLPRYAWSVKRPGFSTALFGAKAGLEVWNAEFQRGFLTRLWGKRLTDELEAGLLEGATLRSLELDHWSLQDVVAHTRHFELETLGVTGATSAKREELEALFSSPVFARLAEFSFNTGTEGSHERAEAILNDAGERAPRLERLALTGTLSNATLRAVRRHEWTRRLTALEVSSPDATEEMEGLLAHLPNLEVLTLSVHRATQALAEVLLAHPTLRQARVRTSAPTQLEGELGERLRAKLGPEALVRL